jgi:hypothetical protein
VLRNIVSEHCELAPTEYTKETALELVAINFCYIDGTTMMWQGTDPRAFLKSFELNEQAAILDAFEWAAPEKAAALRKKPTHSEPRGGQ